MQNAYLEMMEATQRAISRANDISATAEKVTNMLGVHKDDLARMGEVISGRFQAIRESLAKDEADFLAQIGTMRSELDAAIAKMQGVPPEDLSGFGSASGRPPGESPVEVSAELRALSEQRIAGGDNGEG
jgi:ABC-type transporter Mla subunit MlaD